MKTMKRLFGIAMLLVVSMVANAQVVVAIGEFTGGTIVEKSQADRVVTITVTPAENYYIAKSDIVVVPTLNPNPNTSRGSEIPLAEALTLEGDDPEDLSEARDYTFVVPEGLGAWVSTAEFHETVVTNLILDEDVTELDEKLLSDNPAVKTITITNDQVVVSVGKCDVAGLTIDVPGNLYNAYKTTEGWDKAEIISTTGVEMGITFGDNNSYAAFVSVDQSVKVPMGLNALAVTGIKGSSVVIEEIEGVIPAGLPVLLLSKEMKGNDFRTALTKESGKEVKSVLEVAPEGGQEVAIGEVYLLYNDVFYFSQQGTVPEGGIYLPASAVLEDQVKDDEKKDQVVKTRSFLTIGDDNTTAIDASRLSPLASHLSGAWYSLDGRRLSSAPTRKGIYILNGQKTLIK